jgi:hypothetical protein
MARGAMPVCSGHFDLLPPSPDSDIKNDTLSPKKPAFYSPSFQHADQLERSGPFPIDMGHFLVPSRHKSKADATGFSHLGKREHSLTYNIKFD